MLKLFRALLALLVSTAFLICSGIAHAQVCSIISDSGLCQSTNTVITGVNDGSAAFCITSGIYVGLPGVIGTIFISALTNQTCPKVYPVISVNQFSRTEGLGFGTSYLKGTQVVTVNDTGGVYFAEHAREDCATGFTVDDVNFDPLACALIGPIAGNLGNPCLGGEGPPPDGTNGFSNGDGSVAPLCSPIIIDTEGEGFHLTSAANGVRFDIRGDGHPLQIGWTDPKYHNAFLVLDRNGDGKINSGSELFGNFTIQDHSSHPNGFLALAEFDEADQGGNSDGVIDEHDAVFAKLRLWIDKNHDGISQPDELYTLPELGIFSLSLDYGLSRKQDEFGNQYRFKALVNPGHRDPRDSASEAGRWAFDVFLVAR